MLWLLSSNAISDRKAAWTARALFEETRDSVVLEVVQDRLQLHGKRRGQSP
jgi:hypothetical protein